MEFVAWNKIPRIENEKYHFTEKIDGTNACIRISNEGEFATQSRTRFIVPGDDNYGFAKWAHENKEELMKLGPGCWFGEWWGQGIQRGYDLTEKRFSLFYYDGEIPTGIISRVPTLPVSTVEEAKQFLKENGSVAAPGYMRPEGAVVYNTLTKNRYKIIIDK